jgi:hypothetical protein
MRKGGGKAKGSQFERDSGRLLSLWLTDCARGDIFSRNVLSGGAFTAATKAGKASSRMPGDLMAAHPLAFRFLSKFSVECKHHANIKLMQYLLDPKGTSELARIISLARHQAEHIKLEFMVISKQNRVEPIVFVSEPVGSRMLDSLRKDTVVPMYHRFHNGRVFCLRLCDMISMVDPHLFLGE